MENNVYFLKCFPLNTTNLKHTMKRVLFGTRFYMGINILDGMNFVITYL